MTKEEAMEVLKTINEMYPKFNLTKRKARILVPNLIKMDYSGVMKNLSDYVMNHPYPPTLNEIAAYVDDGISYAQEVKKWEEEARKVPQEMKEQFQVLLEKLVREKGLK